MVGETTAAAGARRLLPAYVEIMLAAGDLDAARSACRELDEIAARQGSDMLGRDGGPSAGCGGACRGRCPSRAARAAPSAGGSWQELEAPYEAARVRVLLGLACRALGDEDTAALELEAARERLRSSSAPRPTVARVDSLARAGEPPATTA